MTIVALVFAGLFGRNILIKIPNILHPKCYMVDIWGVFLLSIKIYLYDIIM